MNYKEFMEEVAERVRSKVTGEVTITTVRKNNDVATKGLVIRENGKEIAPVIYMAPYYGAYLGGKDMDEILEDICEEYLKEIPINDLAKSRLSDFEQIRPYIVFRLINYEMNKLLLEEIPHQKYLDLAVVFCYLIYDDKGKGQASILLRNEHLEHWGVSAEEVAELAYENTPRLLEYKLVTMEQMLDELCDPAFWDIFSDTETSSVPQMIILTNRSKLNGAGCILYPDVLEEFAEKTGTNFIILPCSIHEVILIPVKADKIPDREDYCKMICEVNRTQLDDTEVLSDHPYFYDRVTAQISAA